MLTENQVHAFHRFQNAIVALDQTLNSVELDRTALHQKIRSLQQIFQEEIQPIQSEHYQTHSVLVEINKQMRLLGMDGMFLQTARQAGTIETRLGQVRDRIKFLTNYCSAILGTEPD
ncbi:heterocyst frequency control protein PatD [Cyanobacteria bacterium FACHB-63]|nr:heterocyst frequency control protein PatD [Cyanobacteria bacterium FACHB-63]